MDDFEDFEDDTPSEEPPEYESRFPSVEEMRNLLAGHNPDREPQTTIAKPKTGTITRLSDGIGFICYDIDNRGISFSRDGVAGDGFDGLQVGDRVTFEITRTGYGIEAGQVEVVNSAG